MSAKPREGNIKELRARTLKVIRTLRKRYPAPKTALEFSNPLELLVATVLSAQCTDQRVNIVTRELFNKYRSAEDYAAASQEELESDVRSTGFFRNKAKSIRAFSKVLVESHGGNVPRSFDDLVNLPGVGRKTANCVMGAAFGINSGVVVDTHVKRIAARLGLTSNTDPEKIENDLMAVVPEKDWYDLSNMLIQFGREVCEARKPRCPECPLFSVCPSGEELIARFWKEVPKRRRA